MAAKQTIFQDSWLKDKDYKHWVQPMSGNSNYAFCTLCNSEVHLSNMGVQALKSHAKGKKHQAKALARSSSSILSYTVKSAPAATPSTTTPSVPPPSSAPTPSRTKEAAIVESVPAAVNPGAIMDKFLFKDNVTSAEILWCLETVMTHKSLRSAEKDVPLMARMFPDSDVAKKMQLGRDKISYVVMYGLAPYFREELLDLILQTEFYVIGFDESLNKITRKQQMDLNIRFWNSTKNEVTTRYLNSQFLGRSRAVDLLAAFNEGTKQLERAKLMQVSMDGPNVNFSFFKQLQIERKQADESLLDLGSCGIHILHGAFKHGARKSTWDLECFLRALHNLFKDVPARRALFTEHTGSKIFPLKFCGHRWLENRLVAERAVNLVPFLKNFVESVKKEKINISCASYHTMVAKLNDQLLTSKLAFFQSIAAEVEPFLRDYQTDDPLVPFLYSDLCQIVKNLLDRFVKPDVIKQMSSVSLELVNDANNHLPPASIRLGFDTKKALKDVRGMKEKDLLMFRLQCKSFLVELVGKLLIRSPLTYPLTKACTALDPNLISSDTELARRRLDKLLSILTDKDKLRGPEADAASRQYRELTEKFKKRFDNFQRQNVRIDKFWCSLLTDQIDLLKVVKLVCCLSHGNANLERGFAVNADCLFENMKEESVVARRQVYDAVNSKGGIQNVEVSKKMILKTRNAHALYVEDKERRKHEAKADEARRVAKRAKEAQARELEAKKLKIMENAQREVEVIEEKLSELQK